MQDIFLQDIFAIAKAFDDKFQIMKFQNETVDIRNSNDPISTKHRIQKSYFLFETSQIHAKIFVRIL